MKEQKNKKVYLEIMRVIAILGVLFCHTGTYGVHHYVETDNAFNYWFGIFLVTVSQFCIPLFFMISGAVLLNREESVAYVYRHRVLKMVAATFLACLIKYPWNIRSNLAAEFNLKALFRAFFEGNAATQHWFLYTYISFLMVLPFLQKLVKVIQDWRWFVYLFLARLVVSSLFPILAHYQQWGTAGLKSPVDGVIIYALMGYFLEHRCEKFFLERKHFLVMLAVTALALLENIHLNDAALADSYYAKFVSEFALPYAIATFLTVKYIYFKLPMPRIIEKAFCFAGGGVFGTYLIEEILREIFVPVYLYLNVRIYSYPAVFVWILVCAVVGILIANLFKKIPYLGKIL